MPTIQNAPLVEAIFEMRWGNKGQNNFEFSSDEQSLLPGKVDAFASEAGFAYLESLDSPRGPNGVGLPHRVTHRFRPAKNQWPCMQLGLGIFTVNQLDQGYKWKNFTNSIGAAVKVFLRTNPERLVRLPDSLCLVLRYQDAFYPASQGLSSQEFVSRYFNIKASLSNDFLGDSRINSAESDLNFRVSMSTSDPEGRITVLITDATINNKPGLLMDTIVESRIGQYSLKTISKEAILEWCEKAHNLQKHAFETLIRPSAYKN